MPIRFGDAYKDAEAEAENAALATEAALTAANEADRDYFDMVQSVACL